MLNWLAQIDWSQTRNTVDQLARTPLSQILMMSVVLTVVRLVLSPVLFKTPAHKRMGGFTAAKVTNEIADALIYAAVVVFMLLRPFAVQTFTIPTESMVKTLLPNDFVLLDKFTYRRSDPQFGDIVVFRAPEVSRRPGEPDLDYIKRCRGVPGDVVEIRGGVLYRNGKAESEPFKYDAPGMSPAPNDWKLVERDGQYIPVYLSGGRANAIPGLTAEAFLPRTAEEEMELLKAPPAKIPPGHYLFIGDNREQSYDGRSWGLVKRDAIIGRSMYIWLPFNRIGPTR